MRLRIGHIRFTRGPRRALPAARGSSPGAWQYQRLRSAVHLGRHIPCPQSDSNRPGSSGQGGGSRPSSKNESASFSGLHRSCGHFVARRWPHSREVTHAILNDGLGGFPLGMIERGAEERAALRRLETEISKLALHNRQPSSLPSRWECQGSVKSVKRRSLRVGPPTPCVECGPESM